MSEIEYFKGKRALITGGTKGLGLVTACLLAKNGVDIVVTYRSDENGARKAIELIEKYGVRCRAFACDLAMDGTIDRLFDQITKDYEQFDFYIHNAAATSFKSLLDLEAHHIDKTLNISVKSLILAIKKLCPMMPNGGAIVTVSGMDTLRAVPNHGLLGAAKSALQTLTAYYAHELAPQGIRANCVNPGFFASDSTQRYLGPSLEAIQKQYKDTVPSKSSPTIEEIAKVILFLCSENARWIVGQTLYVDGGFQFALP